MRASRLLKNTFKKLFKIFIGFLIFLTIIILIILVIFSIDYFSSYKKNMRIFDSEKSTILDFKNSYAYKLSYLDKKITSNNSSYLKIRVEKIKKSEDGKKYLLCIEYSKFIGSIKINEKELDLKSNYYKKTYPQSFFNKTTSCYAIPFDGENAILEIEYINSVSSFDIFNFEMSRRNTIKYETSDGDIILNIFKITSYFE